ncbi:unnamed protein product [Owenia fusiformis]|uniref:Uncharacterized protein n=1 Tax=Owenia fusiformis TaxID=6347 RepID=A0A8J1TGW7_OWEFU|nr:unnamed protein product [Owenia fusiformis]
MMDLIVRVIVRVILITMASMIHTEGLFCPVGYNLVRDTLAVNLENMTWSEAALECARTNGTIINVIDNRSKEMASDTIKQYSLDKVWIGYTPDIRETFNPSDVGIPYFIIKDISDDQFSASSSWSWSDSDLAKIDSENAWVSYQTEGPFWVQVDLGKTMCIHGIVTKGKENRDWWTTVYKLLYRKDGDNFRTLQDNEQKELSANTDKISRVYRNFTKPFDAQFIRLYPQYWNDYPAISFDLLVSRNSCPTDFTCGRCPAIVNTDAATLTIQYESCCSKLPYICEIESCDKDQEEAPTVAAATHSTVHNTTKDHATHATSTVSCSTTLTIGLTIGIILFMTLSITLIILQICSYHKQNRYSSKAANHHLTGTDKVEMDQQGAMVTPKQLKTEPKDNNDKSLLDSSLVYANMQTGAATYNTGVEAKDDVAHNTTDTVLYHTPADVDVYCVEKKVDNSEILDGIVMLKNDIYSEA